MVLGQDKGRRREGDRSGDPRPARRRRRTREKKSLLRRQWKRGEEDSGRGAKKEGGRDELRLPCRRKEGGREEGRKRGREKGRN